MDLLNHRSDQKLVLPNLDVSIQVLHIEGDTVTVGSSAPSDTPFSQQQDDNDQQITRAGVSREHVTKAHDPTVHERLVDVRISAGLLRRQLGQGSLEEAGDTIGNGSHTTAECLERRAEGQKRYGSRVFSSPQPSALRTQRQSLLR